MKIVMGLNNICHYNNDYCCPHDIMFTFFTPVFNREKTLHRVFDSLVQQTRKNFEWIIVDDGSQDGSLSLAEEFARRAEFKVRVFSQEHSGKHRAWNYAVNMAEGFLFIPLDSDDACLPETIEIFEREWGLIPEDERQCFSGINVLCKDPENGEVIGDCFPRSPFDSNNLEIEYVYRIRGEKWGCIRTDILKKITFDLDTEGSFFFPESYLWFRIAKKYRVRCINIVLRVYFLDQSGTLSGKNKKISNLDGKYLFDQWNLNNNFDYLRQCPIELIRTSVNIIRLGLHTGRSLSGILNSMVTLKMKFYIAFFIIPGYIFTRLDRFQNRIEDPKRL